MAKKILVVDDEIDNVRLLESRLQASGYGVIIASDGLEALEKARQDKPDVIILDVMLPKMDGYKVCRMLKLDLKYKHIPIIMITGRAQDSDRNAGQEAGADAYIIKPFKIEELFGMIQAVSA